LFAHHVSCCRRSWRTPWHLSRRAPTSWRSPPSAEAQRRAVEGFGFEVVVGERSGLACQWACLPGGTARPSGKSPRGLRPPSAIPPRQIIGPRITSRDDYRGSAPSSVSQRALRIPRKARRAPPSLTAARAARSHVGSKHSPPSGEASRADAGCGRCGRTHSREEADGASSPLLAPPAPSGPKTVSPATI